MTFDDIFKKSFIDSWTASDITIPVMVFTLLVASFLAIYIFFIYQLVTKKTFYSKNFNISLAGVTVITSAIILTIQSSIVISLGMVGALSIVRFRTAIKDPLDLMFLFWSISVGIICGARLPEFAVLLSALLTAGVIMLNKMPLAQAPMILVLNSTDINAEEKILELVSKYVDSYNVKSRNITATSMDLTVEVRTSKGARLVNTVSKLRCIESASLISHDGEVTF